jgi:hypothetical protein
LGTSFLELFFGTPLATSCWRSSARREDRSFRLPARSAGRGAGWRHLSHLIRYCRCSVSSSWSFSFAGLLDAPVVINPSAARSGLRIVQAPAPPTDPRPLVSGRRSLHSKSTRRAGARGSPIRILGRALAPRSANSWPIDRSTLGRSANSWPIDRSTLGRSANSWPIAARPRPFSIRPRSVSPSRSLSPHLAVRTVLANWRSPTDVGDFVFTRGASALPYGST